MSLLRHLRIPMRFCAIYFSALMIQPTPCSPPAFLAILYIQSLHGNCTPTPISIGTANNSNMTIWWRNGRILKAICSASGPIATPLFQVSQPSAATSKASMSHGENLYTHVSGINARASSNHSPNATRSYRTCERILESAPSAAPLNPVSAAAHSPGWMHWWLTSVSTPTSRCINARRLDAAGRTSTPVVCGNTSRLISVWLNRRCIYGGAGSVY